MTHYYVEKIERITEQEIEREVLADIDSIRSRAIDEINNIKDEALDYIANKKEYVVNSGKELIVQAESIDSDINNIYTDTDAVAENTIVEIENNIRNMIVNNGYVMKIVDDGNGNADIVLTMEVS